MVSSCEVIHSKGYTVQQGFAASPCERLPEAEQRRCRSPRCKEIGTLAIPNAGRDVTTSSVLPDWTAGSPSLQMCCRAPRAANCGTGRRRRRRGGAAGRCEVLWRATPRPPPETTGRSPRPAVLGCGTDAAAGRTYLRGCTARARPDSAPAPRSRVAADSPVGCTAPIVGHIHQAPIPRCAGGERRITDKEAPRFSTTLLQ